MSLVVASCASIPSGAPTSRELLSAKDNNTKASLPSYEVIDLDRRIARIAGAKVWETLVGRLPSKGGPRAPLLGVGDILAVSIFESALGGLFTPPATTIGGGAKNVVMPQVVVDRRGYIRIPYAGMIRAAGRTPRNLEFAIEARLKGKAIDPQAVVALIKNQSSLVTVAGLVKRPARFPIGIAHERILDIIAQSGGLAIPDHEARIKLVRGRRSASVSMNTLIARPKENIYVRRGDTIIIERAPRHVTLLGAANRNSSIPFRDEHMTLAQVLGTAGGLQDYRADPAGVFIFRYERPNVLQQIKPDAAGTAGGKPAVIYRLDLRSADGYFIAQQFQMRNKDLVFVANSEGLQLQKFLVLVNAALSGVRSGALTVDTVRSLNE